MKILISGATGLVGSELGKKLSQMGHQLFVLSRSPEQVDLKCPFPQKAISWKQLDNWEGLTDLDAIIHLAGKNIFEQRWNTKVKKQIYDSRVETTKKLVDLANEKCKKLSVFISTSAVGIYGEADDQAIHEDHTLSYSYLGKVCQDWEEPLNHLKGKRWVILRVAPVFSEKEGALQEMVSPIQMGYGGTLAGGQFHMSWIDIDDLVNMYVFAFEESIQGTFNAVAPTSETNATISQSIADHLNTKLGPNAPLFAMKLLLGEMAGHIVESQTISPQKIIDKGFRFQCREAKTSIEKRVAPLRGTEKRKIFEQWIPRSKEDIFPFFADAKNLEEITPANLNFKILSSSSDNIEKGTEIHYKLKIDGIPIKWKTVISEWNPPHQFADNQEKGPYTKWYHVHKFENLASGTLMIDQVDFQLPLGILGHMAAGWKVLRDVENIFKYRQKIIYEKFS